MALHWTYLVDGPSGELEQGDILTRTPKLDTLLTQYYPRYAANRENHHFIVLTQSCDLMPRKEGVCEARYILLAPVRPIEVAMQRKLAEFIRRDLSSDPPVCGRSGESRVRDWLERLYNNNESSYFYLRKQPEMGLAEDSCAFLALSIAIKSDQHYKSCLDARCLSLNPIFQAKLGWLVGQMYSRIGTPDWAEEDMNKEINAVIETLAIWVDDRSARALKKLIVQWGLENPGASMGREQLIQLVEKIPQRKLQVVERVLTLLLDNGLVQQTDRKRASNLIRNDPELAALLPK